MRYVLAIIVGGVCGTVSFFAAYSLVNWRPFFASSNHNMQIYAPLEYHHNGIVITQNMTNKTILIQEESVFQIGTSTGQLQFTYDDTTRWSSLEFVFRDGLLNTRRLKENERERPLPKGALVWLSRDPAQSMPWRIASISFLRRTDL